MPYPLDKPLAKHDLVHTSDAFVSLCGTTSTAASQQQHPVTVGVVTTVDSLLHTLEQQQQQQPQYNQLTRISSIYSYQDSPVPPLSRSLCIIGVLQQAVTQQHQPSDNNIGWQQLLKNNNNQPTSLLLQKCTIAVKRADGEYAQRLTVEERTNSYAFAQRVRQLQHNGTMAILAQDKYHRFGILVPPQQQQQQPNSNNDDDSDNNRTYEAQDFAATCYVGTLQAIRNQFSTSTETAKTSVQPEPEKKNDDEIWKPSVVSSDNDYWQPPNETTPEISYNFTTTNIGDSTASSMWQPTSMTTSTTINNSSNNYDDRNNMYESKAITTLHADSGAAAADRFYSGLTRTLDTRSESRLFHMRAYNGWVKATQVQELDPKTVVAFASSSSSSNKQRKPNSPLRVLDLACGKGGDLGKWIVHSRGIQNYVGIDVARGSLIDAAIRARKLRSKLKQCTFTCADLGSDVPGRLKSKQSKYMQKLSMWSLERDNHDQQQQQQHQNDPEIRCGFDTICHSLHDGNKDTCATILSNSK
jgi:mRNA capping enzyme